MSVRLVAHEEPLPGYRLMERLGRGGFGEVWKVEAPGGLLKAMKFVFGDLDASDDESRPAEQELKALKRVQTIRHPYILSLERYDIIDGQLLIVMELADHNLWDRFRECRSQGLPGVPRDELLRYMEEAAEALDLMNNHYHIQHLDIKPQNLFVVFNHVKVGDFGLAKLLEGVRATVTGGVTPVYAAPETFEGWVSQFSDQYSLAIVFQELLTGTRPFTGANTRQLLMQHISGSPELTSLSAADKPIIARALSKKPDERWPTCTDMVRGLKLAGHSPPTGIPTGPDRLPGVEPRQPDSTAATRPVGATRARPDSEGPIKTQTPRPPYNPGLALGRSGGGSGSGVTANSMPALVTAGAARLVTPQGSSPTPAVTLQRPVVFQTARMNSLGIAPPERTGDGSLFPALVVGVGHLGRLAIEHLRRMAAERYASTDRLPHLRFLNIDTDTETPETDVGGSPRELVLARLNRPAHYLQHASLPPLDAWMPPGAVYKLPRNPGPAGGVRAFGRLALFDNYRVIAQRLRQEIETFLTDDPLATADKSTGLGLRTNRPRAYLIAGLAGGTGSGMFLDLAYLLRHELRSVGYLRPEVVGMFFVPPADKTASRNASLGNTFAALTELHHYQARRTKYQTTFDKSEAPILDGDPPFARAAVLQLPKAVNPVGQGKVAALAARALFDELLTPAGRVIDEVRDVYRNAFPTQTPTAQTFGLFRLSWPRPEVLTAATRRFAQRLLQRWTAKEAAHLQEPIAAWLEQQWVERKLGFEQLVEVFQTAVRTSLREDPDRVFDAFTDPLRTRTPSGARLDAASACAVLDQLLKVVGKPPCEDAATSGSLQPVLQARYEEVAKEGEVGLATMAVSFIEQPLYRLAGAEEAVRQIGEKLKRQVETLEPIHKELDREVKGIFGRLFQVIGSLGTSLWKGSAAEVIELLRSYPRKRLQLHVLDMCLSVYRKLLNNAPEYLREISFCRSTLNEMHTLLGKPGGPAGDPIGPGKMILPDGSANLDAAADRFLAALTPEDILAFDQQAQKDVARKFRGLAAVCLKPSEKGPPFRELLLTRGRAFLDTRLDAADPATIFFRCRSDVAENLALLKEAYQGAAPGLAVTAREPGKQPDQLAILAVPPGPDGDRFRALAAEALPGVEFTPAQLPDDIVFHRECPQVELTDLPQLGEFAREAYQQLTGSEHAPHARVDIPWQPPGSP